MGDVYVFADEAGNFDFSRRRGASRYFILCTVTSDHCGAGDALQRLRRELGWRGLHLDRTFHATEDPQAIRNEVYRLLSGLSFRIDATIFEKPKTVPYRQEFVAFYRLAWYLHFKHIARRIAAPSDRLFVVASGVGTKRQRSAAHTAVASVVDQLTPCRGHRVAFWQTASDPCHQVADYCTWAIQRKWEGDDDRSHVLIADKIASEFDVWRVGNKYYY